MKIRPSLLRKKTINLDVLKAEKQSDSDFFEDVFKSGDNLVKFKLAVEAKIDEIKTEEGLSEADKNILIGKLDYVLSEIEEVYSQLVSDDYNYITDASKERLEEIEIARRKIRTEIFEMQEFSFGSGSINKEKIIGSLRVTENNYDKALDEFSNDLNDHIKRICEQREKIRKKQEK